MPPGIILPFVAPFGSGDPEPPDSESPKSPASEASWSDENRFIISDSEGPDMLEPEVAEPVQMNLEHLEDTVLEVSDEEVL